MYMMVCNVNMLALIADAWIIGKINRSIIESSSGNINVELICKGEFRVTAPPPPPLGHDKHYYILHR